MVGWGGVGWGVRGGVWWGGVGWGGVCGVGWGGVGWGGDADVVTVAYFSVFSPGFVLVLLLCKTLCASEEQELWTEISHYFYNN